LRSSGQYGQVRSELQNPTAWDDDLSLRHASVRSHGKSRIYPHIGRWEAYTEDETMLDAIFDIFNGETEEERQIKELQAMDDHQLADLGISRDQISSFVRDHTANAHED